MAVVERTVSGAHYGVRDWLVQRISALVMALYSVLLLILLLARPVADYRGWRALFEPEWMRYATLLFALSLFWHAWIGMRDIFMDYLKPTGARLLAEAVVILALLAYALWTVDILWRLA
jgi:succinate dehydrogenase / fumarate reductase membrane anchor subunit